ncbi:MAG: type transport system ATP-binding protein, partial [Solirubrobacteraceae bacterium]|nr:type transport system ATP-binding protein [Solirubrobacteraceae bacterium]
EGRTVFLSSHLMAEIAQTAEHLIIIGRGKLIADTSVADILSEASRDSAVRVRSPQAAELSRVLKADGGRVESPAADQLEVSGMTSAQVGTIAARHGLVLHELIAAQASLEDAFMRLTGGELEYHAGELQSGTDLTQREAA